MRNEKLTQLTYPNSFRFLEHPVLTSLSKYHLMSSCLYSALAKVKLQARSTHCCRPFSRTAGPVMWTSEIPRLPARMRIIRKP